MDIFHLGQVNCISMINEEMLFFLNHRKTINFTTQLREWIHKHLRNKTFSFVKYWIIKVFLASNLSELSRLAVRSRTLSATLLIWMKPSNTFIINFNYSSGAAKTLMLWQFYTFGKRPDFRYNGRTSSPLTCSRCSFSVLSGWANAIKVWANAIKIPDHHKY